MILSMPAEADPTRGATSFIEPELQDKLVAQGVAGYRLTYVQVRDRWMKGGQRPMGRVGRFEFWRRAG
jgi:hypothetical protein